ncbi:hypothetical protein ACGFKX_15625 [Pseudonocardia alni]|uniref:hypothetical protein n=1 Tax=Pseudonocardia alni TaxID=33907 RepID=UPI003720863A
MHTYSLASFRPEDDDPADRVATTVAGYNRAEHERVLGAVAKTRAPGVDPKYGDWDQAFYLVRDRGSKRNNMSLSTFRAYASAKTGTTELRDFHAVGVANILGEQVVSDDPYTRERVAKVQDAVHRLPRAQFEAVVRYTVVVSGADVDPLTETEKRTFRRACTRLARELSALATGYERPLRPRRDIPLCRQDVYESGAKQDPVTVSRGTPCVVDCACERHEKRPTVTIAPGPEWGSGWHLTVPEPRDDWHEWRPDGERHVIPRIPSPRRPATDRYDVVLEDSAVLVAASRMSADAWVADAPGTPYRIVKCDRRYRVDYPKRLPVESVRNRHTVIRGSVTVVDFGDGFLRAA